MMSERDDQRIELKITFGFDHRYYQKIAFALDKEELQNWLNQEWVKEKEFIVFEVIELNCGAFLIRYI